LAIRNKNLNLLPVLQALLKHGSVVKAADEVGLSQPAMSGCLARLRELLGDPLLVRVGRSMRLTPYATEMRGEVNYLCGKIEHLFEPKAFDPTVESRLFRIGCPDYIAFLLSDALVEPMRELAPGIELHFVDVPGNVEQLMEDVRIDLLVCADFGFWPSLKREFVFTERYVAAVSASHPLLERKGVKLADLQSYPGVTVNYDSSFGPAGLHRRGPTGIPILDIDCQLSSMSQFIALFLANNSSLVARAPASLVARLSDVLKLEIVKLAAEKTEFDTFLLWAAVTDQEPGHQWLRTTVRDHLVRMLDKSLTANRPG
jgi:DNA-binding transcriptional LysR family regulator